ncbi:MAG: hypothetical protein HZB26_24280 [Candidatus Hydrogenedentes bacterium]|nr:hypothetical protein [Candidatus Hydrogenedentota bacterium]
MGTLQRTIVWGLAAVLVLAGRGWADTEEEQDPSKLEGVVKAAVGAVLSWVLEAPCSVEGVHWEKGGQYLELTGLRIGNPLGFKTDHALTAESVRVEAEPRKLLAPNPEIRLIQVKGASVIVETRLSAGSNLKRLMDAAARPKLAAAAVAGRPMPSGAGKKFRIDRGVLDGCDVIVDTTALGRTSSQRRPVGPIEMSFAGADGAGLPVDQAMAQFLGRLIQEFGAAEKQDAPEQPEKKQRGLLGRRR